MNQRKIKLPSMNPNIVAKEIGGFIIKEITSIGKTGAVIGLSGGVDSTVTAALAKKAFDKYNINHERKLELAGYLLPSSTNSVNDEKDARKVAEKLKITYIIQSIEPIIEAYIKPTNRITRFAPEEEITSLRYSSPGEIEDKNTVLNTFGSSYNYHKGNLMSRIRANYLSTKAAIRNNLVLGTGNKDEDYGIGYYTLFGDGAVHLSPIGNLPKRLVREMAVYLGFKDIAYKIPTAGLEVGQTDFKDLGYNYDTVELIIEAINQGFEHEEIIRNKQVIGQINKDIQDYQKEFSTYKFDTVEKVVNNIYKRHKIAEKKAEIIHPPTAEVTLNYN